MPLEPLGSVGRVAVAPARTPGELVWIDTGGDLHRSQVKEGKLGVMLLQYRNLVHYYLKHGQRDASWDPVVVAAIIEQERDAMVSESLWAHAIQLGYKPDQLSSFFGMCHAIANGDASKAAWFGRNILRSDSEHAFPLSDEEWQQLFAVTGDLAWLEPVVERVARGDSQLTAVVDFKKFQQNLKAPPAGLESPATLAGKMKRRTFLAQKDFERTWGQTNSFFRSIHLTAIASHKGGNSTFEAIPLSIGIDSYLSGWMGPGERAKDLDVSITFRAAPIPIHSGRTSGFGRSVTFGLADRRHQGSQLGAVPTSSRILAVNLNFGQGEPNMTGFWTATCASGDVDFKPFCRSGRFPSTTPPATEILPVIEPGERFHTLRVVRVGNQAEALLGGGRLMLANLPDGLDEPGAFLHFVGIRLEVTGFTADILE